VARGAAAGAAAVAEDDGREAIVNVHRWVIHSVCLGLVLLHCGAAHAQDSRADEIAAEQAKKARDLKPYVESAAERWTETITREFLAEPGGFYPFFGSVYSGGGFTLGAGYRQFYGDRTHWDVKGLYSFKNYKYIAFSTDSWGLAHGLIDLHANVGWRDATQVAYYGLGIESPQDRSNFGMKQAFFGGDMAIRPGGHSVFGAGLAYEDFTLEEGAGTDPSIEQIHTPATAPGLGESPSYIHTMASAGIDWRPAAGYARTGGLYQISYHDYADRNGSLDFDRVDGEIVQHIPILRENWVFSAHGLVQTILDDDNTVPYFLLPSLGSGSTLRAYPAWRFRDRHSLLMSGEFRWIPSRRGIDMAVFYDAGKVVPRWDDLSLKGLKHDVGVGIRFHGPAATPLRIEVAKGREGFNLVFAGSAAF
jgi:hypothetical protein